jgi:Tripartite tricarboxylate transporter TctB family
MIKLRNPRDFWAGVIFLLVGIGAALVAWDYPMGTGGRMGAGYFPMTLAVLLGLLGALIMAMSFGKEGPPVDKFALKPLFFILLAVVIFGLLAKVLGLAISIVILVVVSAYGGHEFRFKETLIAGIVLAAFCVLVFSYGLKLPFPIFPSFLAN